MEQPTALHRAIRKIEWKLGKKNIFSNGEKGNLCQNPLWQMWLRKNPLSLFQRNNKKEIFKQGEKMRIVTC